MYKFTICVYFDEYASSDYVHIITDKHNPTNQDILKALADYDYYSEINFLGALLEGWVPVVGYECE